MSQEGMILKALKSGDKITPLMALSKYGCMRLAARIYDLRAKGHDIKVRKKCTAPETYVAEYWIDAKA